MHIDHVLYLTDLPAECIDDCGRGPGAKDEAVEFWRRKLEFTVDRDNAIRCLRGYGAWDQEQLDASTDDELADRVLWLACGDFSEFQVHCERAGVDSRGEILEGFDPSSGSDIFCLE